MMEAVSRFISASDSSKDGSVSADKPADLSIALEVSEAASRSKILGPGSLHGEREHGDAIERAASLY